MILYIGEVNSGPPLSTVIGQYGLQAQDFCEKFNEIAKDLPNGLPVHVIFYVLPEKKFTFSIYRIPTYLILPQLFKIKWGIGRCVDKLELYKFFRFRKYWASHFDNNFFSVRTFFASLRVNKVRSVVNLAELNAKNRKKR